MAIGVTDDKHYKAIADVLRSYTNPDNTFTPSEMPEGIVNAVNAGTNTARQEGYDSGYEAGRKSEYDKLWDNLQQNGTRAQYVSAFAYTGWNDKNYNPKYPITPTNTNGMDQIFNWNQRITDTKVPITAHGNCRQAFYQAVFLKRIPKLIFNGATNVSNMFYGCDALEELNAEGELTLSLSLSDSTKLNKTSIESLVSVLSSSTSGQALTLSATAVNNAFAEAEWSALIATKTNWTISLV